MSNIFSQFLLHSTIDTHPRSWICVSGKNIPFLMKKLERGALNATGLKRWALSEQLALELKCSHNTIEQLFRRKEGFYPIPVILELAKLNRNGRELLKRFEQSIEYLKVNSASARPIKAIHRLSPDLAKILGAFMADGSLSVQVVVEAPSMALLKTTELKLSENKITYSRGKSGSRGKYYLSFQVNKTNLSFLRHLIPSTKTTQTHYNLELTDKYKDNVETFNRWVKNQFDIEPTFFSYKKNSWRTIFSNKILARFLMQNFNIVPGPKTYTAFEPRVIQSSPFYIRKAFGRGLMMFDGSVTTNRKIVFSTVSKTLFNSLRKIWRHDGINFCISINHRRGEYNLITTADNPIEKLLTYFEVKTQKWKLLKWLSGETSYTPLMQNVGSISLEKVLNVIKKVKKCDTFLIKKYFSCSHTTARNLLKTLYRQGKIKLSQRPNGIYKHGVEKNTTVYLVAWTHRRIFQEIKKQFSTYKNCSKIFGIHNATLSAWKVRKNRIPLRFLEKLCEILNFNYEEVLSHVEETDREIAEII